MNRLGILLVAYVWLWATGVSAQTDAEKLSRWMAGQTVGEEAVKDYGLDRCFVVEPVNQELMKRMSGKSYPKNCTVPAGQLRYLKVLHRRNDGTIGIGEMVCHHSIAEKLRKIFRVLYNEKYPIERMVLIDEYDANDERSMTDNNTSCFCFRRVAGTKRLSKHAQGLAVDINPLYNPQVKTSPSPSKGGGRKAASKNNSRLRVSPKAGASYADRSKAFPYKVKRGDLCYQLFLKEGFRWGGNWRYSKDYQHFEYLK